MFMFVYMCMYLITEFTRPFTFIKPLLCGIHCSGGDRAKAKFDPDSDIYKTPS